MEPCNIYMIYDARPRHYYSRRTILLLLILRRLVGNLQIRSLPGHTILSQREEHALSKKQAGQ